VNQNTFAGLESKLRPELNRAGVAYRPDRPKICAGYIQTVGRRNETAEVCVVENIKCLASQL
jgi:hypothetical protein